MNEDAAHPIRHGTNGRGDGPNEIQTLGDGLFAWRPPAHLSPSLWEDREEPAFELKFLLDDSQARSVIAWATQHLQLDPHARPELGGGYRVHGLYFDTGTLDVFHRSTGYRRKKYRLRRYDGSDLVFLEQKRKTGNRVAKRRTQVSETELARLVGVPEDAMWAGHWFHRRISVRRLQPSCQISYERQAFTGECAEGPLRLTLDRKLRCLLTDRCAVHEVVGGLPLLPTNVLMELKYRGNLPSLFKALIEDFALAPQPLSKYRLAQQAWRGESLVREVG